MHPADQFEAFAALVAEGRSIETRIAAVSASRRWWCSAGAETRQRVAARLADYRAEAVSLDQLMALAITTTMLRRKPRSRDAPTWQRGPHNPCATA